MKEPPGSWVCSHCGAKHKLKINIFEEPVKWREIKCSKCGEKRVNNKIA